MGMSRIHVAMFKNILHDQYSSEEEKYFRYVPVNEYGVLCQLRYILRICMFHLQTDFY